MRSTPSARGDPHRAAGADENSALPLRQGEEAGLVRDPHMTRDREFEAAADAGARHRRDERDRSARDVVEGALESLPAAARAVGGIVDPRGRFDEIEPGAEILAMAKDQADLRLIMRPQRRFAQLRLQRLTEGIPLLGAVKPDERDRSVAFVGDKRLGQRAFPQSRPCVPHGIGSGRPTKVPRGGHD